MAIAIPIFTAQLEKSKEATDLANVRSAYAEAVSNYLTDDEAATYEVSMKSDLDDCKSSGDVAGVAVEDILTNKNSKKGADPCVITVSASGAVTINGVAATTSTGTKK